MLKIFLWNFKRSFSAFDCRLVDVANMFEDGLALQRSRASPFLRFRLQLKTFACNGGIIISNVSLDRLQLACVCVLAINGRAYFSYKLYSALERYLTMTILSENTQGVSKLIIIIIIIFIIITTISSIIIIIIVTIIINDMVLLWYHYHCYHHCYQYALQVRTRFNTK